MEGEQFPWSWEKVVLGLFPGFLATLGFIRFDFSVEALVGLVLLVVFLLQAFWRNKRRLPAWSLIALGMLASVILTMVTGVLAGVSALLVGESANAVVLLVLLMALIFLLRILLREKRVTRLAWVLSLFVVVCQLAVRLKFFVILGISWSVVGQWFMISLFAAVTALLLPVALGWFLAESFGPARILFVLGMVFIGFQVLIDVNEKVSYQMGDSLEFIAYKVLIPLIFTVFAPLWFMRGQTPQVRIAGVLGLVGLAVVLDLVIVGLSYRGELPFMIWMSFIPYTLSVVLTLILANVLYRESDTRLTQPKGVGSL